MILNKIQGWAEEGNTTVLVSNLPSSNKVQGSFPLCTITVYEAGTSTKAAIFSDNASTPTPLANPFTAIADGSWAFWAEFGLYDIVFSGSGITVPFTLYSVGIPSDSRTIDISTIPSYGELWQIANGTLISVVVTSSVATVTTSTPHGLSPNTSVVDLVGCYTDDELNGAAKIVQNTPTATTFTLLAAGVSNGTYVDTSLAIQNLTSGIFGSDLSNSFATKFTIEATVDRMQLYDQYFDYPLYPRIVQYYVKSGYSGTTAIINGVAGVSQVNKKLVPVNNTTGFSAGLTILLTNSAGLVETRKIQSIAVGVSITLTTDLENDYISGDIIGVASRTNSSAYFTDLQMFNGAGGDLYGHTIRIELANAPQWGQNHPYYNGTGGLIGGDVTASANQVYGQATEVAFIDAGFDVTMIGDVRNYIRTNDTRANGQTWVGAFHQSFGSKYSDSCFIPAGAWRVGFDAVPFGGTADLIAFQMKALDRFYLNSSKSVPVAGPLPIWGDVVGTSWFTYNSATGAIEFYTAGNLQVGISGSGITPYGRVQGVEVGITAANNLTLGNGNANVLTGTTQINLINSTGWNLGSIISLQFAPGNTTVKQNQAASGAFLPIFLDGGVDLIATNADMIFLKRAAASWLQCSPVSRN